MIIMNLFYGYNEYNGYEEVNPMVPRNTLL